MFADPGSDAELAVAAAQAGAAVVLGRYETTLTRFGKGGDDFATDADVAGEQAVIEVIKAARPGDALTGEESGSAGEDDADRRWLIDPLCGTLNYAARTMLASVNVALLTRHGVTAAAVADPFASEVCWTDGQRAWCRSGGTDAPLAPSAESRLVDVNLDPPFPNAPGFRAVSLLADPAFSSRFRPRVVSTTLAVAWVAADQRTHAALIEMIAKQ